MPIVVGYVPTPEGRAAFERAIEEARLRKLRLIVVNASSGDALVDSRFASTHDWDAVQAQLAESGIEHETARRVAAGEPADQLLRVAREANAELIVIGLRHRTPVGKFILGSSAQTVLLAAECPVLAVKAGSR
jgi:nucleotide-binding universal stress UspA family protein